MPKVACLALRLNAAYGLDIADWPQPYLADMARGWFHHGASGRECVHLIIGCVDNHLARREMARTVAQFDGRLWALNCGNEQNSGQVLIGNLADGRSIKTDRLGLCSGLPSPYLQEPELLEPDPDAQAPSCADMAQDETQSLMVNRMAATIAAHYTAVFMLQRQVLYLGTAFTLDPPTARSRLITPTTLNPFQQPRRS